MKVLSIDLNLCTGCRSCELRCAFTHHRECNPSQSRMRVVKFDQVGISIPLFCLNCEEAFCEDICPTKAIQREKKTGALVLKEERCVHCLACTMVCPFGGVHALPNRKMVKCDLCDGDPYCVKYCETGALRYVEVEEMGIGKAYALAEKLVLPYLKSDSAPGSGSREE